MLGRAAGLLWLAPLLEAVGTSPHFDNGALLLQNLSDGDWYFWRLFNDGANLIHLPDQTPTAPPVGASPRFIFTNQTDLLNYAVQLHTDSGVVALYINQTPTGQAAHGASVTLKDDAAVDHDVEMINDPLPILSFV